MKNKLYNLKFLIGGILTTIILGTTTSAQTVEWRLVKDSYNSTDPDAGGPAVGSVVFGIEMRSTGATINDITQVSVGFSYQSANLMIPTTSTCTNTGSANNVVGAPFASAGFLYTVVQQCNTVSFSTGGQTFDRTTAGTLDNGAINLTSTFTRALTITMWAKSPSAPQGGYAVINSGEGGSPGPISSYAVTQSFVTPIIANSLTYTIPLPLGDVVTPVTWKDYKVTCSDKGTIVAWSTTSETNSSHYEVEKYVNGTWKVIGTVNGAGNTDIDQDYRYLDLEGGVAQYRVRQVDFDGRFEYTAIRSVSCEDKNISVVIFPVPTRDQLNVAVRTDKAIRTTFEIYDMSGRVVKRHAVNLTVGSNSIPLNVGHLSSGEYIIRSTDGTLKLNQKFTIVR